MPRTTKLSDLQRVVLAHAAQRDDSHVLPLPASIVDDERSRMQIADLIRRKLLSEFPVGSRSPCWREDAGKRIGLVVTASGYAAIGIDRIGDEAGRPCAGEDHAAAAAPTAGSAEDIARPRPASKRAQVIALLSRPGGTTLAELCEQTGWLAHSARAFLTGLRKSGHRVERARNEGVTRYALAETADAQR